LEKPVHPARRGHVCLDLRGGPELGVGGQIWEGFEHLRLQVPCPPRLPPSGSTGRSAGEGQGQLVRKEFIVGEAFAGRGIRQEVGQLLRRVSLGQRLTPGRERLLRRKSVVDPLGQLGRERQGTPDRLAHRLLRDTAD
jgi:hypothetical protein